VTTLGLARDVETASSPVRGGKPGRGWPWAAPAIAATIAIIGAVVGWRGVDLAAQVYRVELFRRVGPTWWDSQWYGGHWTADYSVLFPPVAATLGLAVTATVSAATAALAFDRLVVASFGVRARIGSVLFAVGTMQQLAIGQLAFLLAEALGLCACWAGVRRRPGLAAGLAVACSLCSPLAGSFLALAALAWVIGGRRGEWRAALGILVGALVPIALVTVAFGHAGAFPYPFGDFVFELAAAVAMFLVVPRRYRVLRAGAALYVVATVASFVLQTPMGGNVGRLGECLAIPLGTCLLWPQRRALFVALAVPMALWVWGPAWGAISNRNAAQPSTHRAYYTPLVSFLTAHGATTGRVEVVPTKFHWEAAYVAPAVPLARGWERQLDVAVNPLFYGGRRLDAGTYDAWLVASGVRFVAVPDAPLDYAATAEARLVEAGVPELRLAWRSAHWTVYAVDGSPGIVSGPARLVRMSGGRVELDITAPGTVLVRIRYTGHWSVTRGTACLAPSGQSTALVRTQPGVVDLRVGPLHHPARVC
jgi:hypothetical protein